MVWFWSLAAALLLVMIIFLAGSIQLRMRFEHKSGDEHFAIDVRGGFGLIRYRYVVPVMVWRDGGLKLKMENVNRNEQKIRSEQTTELTMEKVEEYIHRARELLKHTEQLMEWLKRVLRHTKCTEFSWVTHIGLGDAPETAVATGAVWGLKTSILGYLFRYISLQTKPILNVQPQFNSVQFSTSLLCIARINTFYLFYAAGLLSYRVLKVKGGIRTWRKALTRPTG